MAQCVFALFGGMVLEHCDVRHAVLVGAEKYMMQRLLLNVFQQKRDEPHERCFIQNHGSRKIRIPDICEV